MLTDQEFYLLMESIRMSLTTDKQERKETPIARGVIDYFPDAIAAVARVSFLGNRQHNPGTEMHWDRTKSPDHADCIARHLTDRGTVDDDGVRHSAKLAWRALALLQVELEKNSDYPVTDEHPRFRTGGEPSFTEQTTPAPPLQGADLKAIQTEIGRIRNLPDSPWFVLRDTDPRRQRDFQAMADHSTPPEVALQVANGITYPDKDNDNKAYLYLSGRMRGLPNLNFAAFDTLRDDCVACGFSVISPADIDRNSPECESATLPVDQHNTLNPAPYIDRDYHALRFVAARKGSLVAMKDWQLSVGAAAEVFLARWFKLQIVDPDLDLLAIVNVGVSDV